MRVVMVVVIDSAWSTTCVLFDDKNFDRHKETNEHNARARLCKSIFFCVYLCEDELFFDSVHCQLENVAGECLPKHGPRIRILGERV